MYMDIYDIQEGFARAGCGIAVIWLVVLGVAFIIMTITVILGTLFEILKAIF